MRIVIISLAIAWGVYKAAMIAAVVVSSIMGMVHAVQALMAAQQGMNVVQAIFNVLLTANPIGLIITAIGALIALIIVCVKHWDDITAAMSKAWDVIKQVGASIFSALLLPIQKLLELLSMIPGIGKYIKPAAEGLESFRMGLTEDKTNIDLGQAGGAAAMKALSGNSEGSQTVSPVSPAQQAAYYSRQDTYQHAEISVKAEPGTSARVSKPPASPNFNLAVSGSY